MVVPCPRHEGGLGKQPPDEAGQRPCHDCPPKPLKSLSTVVGTGDQVVERPSGHFVVCVLSVASEEDELDVGDSIDDETHDKQDQSNQEPWVVEVAIAELCRTDKLGIYVVVEHVEDESHSWDPQGHLWMAMSSHQRVDYASVYIVNGEEAVEDNVDCPVKVLACDEVGEGEDKNSRNGLRYDVCYTSWNRETFAATSVSPIRHRFKDLCNENK